MSLATRIESLVIRVAQEFNDVRATAQIKLTSQRARSLDLAAGTEHLQIV